MTAFPVVGNVTFTNDFGAPRSQGLHQGNDIMARRHQPTVAFEGGRVDIHYRTLRSTCMLYLHGRSGMTYVYIHLNNDLTSSNDNRGGCKNGVAYAPGLKDGDFVRRGELVGYVGDSGDADGIQPHLHFEIRKPSGRAIDPYTYLLKARRLLYPRPAADPITLALRKSTIIALGEDTVKIRTRSIKLFPNKWLYAYRRKVVLTVPSDVVVERRTPDGPVAATLTSAAVGERARVWTRPFAPSWTTQLAGARVLVVRRILLGAPG